MKIGILTLRLHNNYGGNLQAYALMKYLKSLGHDVVLLNKQEYTNHLTLKEKIKRRTKSLFSFLKPDISKYSSEFIEKYISPKTQPLLSSEDFKELEKDNFDVLIVGSDQVWRADYIRNKFLKEYFLDFVSSNNVKKISYAASLAFEDWKYTKEETKLLERWLNDFSLITVREDSGVEQIKENIGIADVHHVIDPTMLLRKEDYIQLTEENNVMPSPGNCMLYVLDEDAEKQKLIDKICKKNNFKPFTVNYNSSKKYNKQYPPVTDWLKGFMDAKFVITDSFHGTVFAILFNKPFLVLGNHNRGFARFKSLGNMFSVNERILGHPSEYKVGLEDNPIDWETINLKLEAEREKALNLLLKILK